MTAPTRPAVSGTRESATVTTLRQQNRAAALQFVLQAGETTRAELAQRCGFSSASAANITAELIEDGLIAEVGSVASRGGRPISLIAPRADGAYAIGVDVGERGVAVELFDLSLAMVDREFRGGRQEESPDDIHRDLQEAVAELRDRNRERWPRVLGIGLGLPGVVETEADGSQVLYAQSLGWAPRPIPLDLDPDLPVFAENGAKTQARAELWYGAARGIDHAVVALLGRGVGLGVISDGELEHGAFSSAGEWGHTKIRFGGALCRCGQRGCVEAYLGADAILAAWQERGGSFDGSGWQAIGALLTAAQTDAEAASVVDEVIDALGAALGSVVNLTNPERIVVGGWVGMRLMEQHSEQIAAAVRRNCLDRLGAQFELVPATFGGDTVALGSALMPIRALIDAPRSELAAG
ncbi:ROK family transcriptional regulator [Leifsonia aquatica]|uniref:ROK family transcriptional regulator n=1 Tax=Leifsonia aquatica TaxID=144185 RepID=UPI00046AAA20|nr:ROK family transcriptional regulator [Leifsonia aquatica]